MFVPRLDARRRTMRRERRRDGERYTFPFIFLSTTTILHRRLRFGSPWVEIRAPPEFTFVPSLDARARTMSRERGRDGKSANFPSSSSAPSLHGTDDSVLDRLGQNLGCRPNLLSNHRSALARVQCCRNVKEALLVFGIRENYCKKTCQEVRTHDPND